MMSCPDFEPWALQPQVPQNVDAKNWRQEAESERFRGYIMIWFEGLFAVEVWRQNWSLPSSWITLNCDLHHDQNDLYS